MYLTVAQVKSLIEAAQASSNPQLYPFIVIGLETSMRQAEILSIRCEDVDRARRVIWIPQAKAGKREQPITEHLAHVLADWVAALPPGTPGLFPSPAAKLGHPVDIRRPFAKAVVAAGLDPMRVVRPTLQHTTNDYPACSGWD